jgi:hypothetical protein
VLRRQVARMGGRCKWLRITSSTRVWYQRRWIVGSEYQSVCCMPIHNKPCFRWIPTRHTRHMHPLNLGMFCSYSAEICCQFTRVVAALSVYQLATKTADTANRNAFLSMLPVTRSPWTLRALSEYPRKCISLSYLTLRLQLSTTLWSAEFTDSVDLKANTF